ncbi:mechanosensitive ion channel family protein [Zhouia sp. PK063]|uniref:mechanosensitive ion channel family protein n=1 Tax=Zhouia sp. PK063 TaxID=3373602 RepID=UPI0037B7A149
MNSLEAFNNQLEKAWKNMLTKLGDWFNTVIVYLPNFIIAIVVFILSFVIARYSNRLMLRLLGKSHMQSSIKRVLAKLTSIAVVLIGLFLAIAILNLNGLLKTVLTGAGVAGLAVALALQGTLANSFSGILLSFVDYIKIGDWIESNNYKGVIVDIDLRMTTIKEPDNNYVYIPNKMVVENPFKNWSTTTESKVVLSCGVAYESDLEFVKELTLKTVKEKLTSIIKKDDIIFYFTEFGDSSINFEVRFWINSQNKIDMLNAKGEAIIALKKAFDANNINIPFPIRTINFTNPMELKNRDNTTETTKETPPKSES